MKPDCSHLISHKKSKSQTQKSLLSVNPSLSPSSQIETLFISKKTKTHLRELSGNLKMETSRFTLINLLVSFSFFLTLSAQMTGNFNCSGSTSTCLSLVGYSSKNATTLRNIQTLFAVKNLRSILGANNLPLNTSRDQRVNPNQVVRIPIHCSCSNGTGVSNRDIEYTIKKDDTLSFVATEVFGGLVTYQKISEVNKIPDPDKIEIGQKFWIPLPCSCDKLNGEDVVHYAHVVKLGSSLREIAAQFGTDNTTLAQLNGIIGDSQLLADNPLNVPLKG